MLATATHCPYCALQCGQWVDESGAVDAREFPTNRGGLCQKGWTSGGLLAHPERLTIPLLRRSRSAPLEPGGLGRGDRPRRGPAAGPARRARA